MSAESAFEHRQPVRKPGWRKALPWIVGVVAVGAIIGFLGYRYSNTGKSTATPLINKPAQDVSKVPPSVKLTAGATAVARRFIETAVARKNLPEAYGLVTNAIRQGQTLKQWNTGNIAVVPYPVDAVQFAPMKIDYSYPKEALVEIALLPKQHSGIKGQLFAMDLVKRDGRWLVNGWYPRSSPPVPSANSN
jgi:hypothetical protein